MSQVDALSAEAMRGSCKNCKRWHYWVGNMGRCIKYYDRIVVTLSDETCKNFSEKEEEVKNGK